MDLLGRFTIHHDCIAIDQEDDAKWTAQGEHNDMIIRILPKNFQKDVYKNYNKSVSQSVSTTIYLQA